MRRLRHHARRLFPSRRQPSTPSGASALRRVGRCIDARGHRRIEHLHSVDCHRRVIVAFSRPPLSRPSLRRPASSLSSQLHPPRRPVAFASANPPPTVTPPPTRTALFSRPLPRRAPPILHALFLLPPHSRPPTTAANAGFLAIRKRVIERASAPDPKRHSATAVPIAAIHCSSSAQPQPLQFSRRTTSRTQTSSRLLAESSLAPCSQRSRTVTLLSAPPFRLWPLTHEIA